jgi:hypothetical protein
MQADRIREFDVIPRKRWTLVAEWLGSRDDGQRTARWFKDNETGLWYTAESWKRPNLRHQLNDDQAAYVESVIA